PEPDRAALDALLRGVELDDGPARLLSLRHAAPPPEVEHEPRDRGSWLRVEVAEGRKREVRRIFAAVGIDVRRLVRTRVGDVALDGLRAGAWRALTDAEVAALGRVAARRNGALS
ncbi:MAG: pseudouridine synthase, partial [Chloroflexota bacterium]|nr:pseudouridine synthase [Chloroflexota bacterium]